MMATPAVPTFSASYRELEKTPGTGRWNHGRQSELCDRHDPPHVLHGSPGDMWCQALPPHDRPVRLCRPRRQPEAVQRVEIVNAEDLGLMIDMHVIETLRRERELWEIGRAADRAISAPTSAPEPTVRTGVPPSVPVWTPDDSDG